MAMEPPAGWWICWWCRIGLLCEWLPHLVTRPQIVVLEERMRGWADRVVQLTRRVDEMNKEIAVLEDQIVFANQFLRDQISAYRRQEEREAGLRAPPPALKAPPPDVAPPLALAPPPTWKAPPPDMPPPLGWGAPPPDIQTPAVSRG